VSFHQHLIAQRHGLAALVQFLVSGPGKVLPPLPGPIHHATVAAPSDALVRDFVRFCKGDPAGYTNVLPPHLFPQWALPMLLKAAAPLPYPRTKVINAGCRLTVFHPLPKGRSLALSGQLIAVEETQRNANITIRVETRAEGEPVALSADLRVVVPLPKRSAPSGDVNNAENAAARPRREPPRVEPSARKLAQLKLSASAGLDFAELTGDFNPIHWLSPYARALRFKNVILHGFGTAALAFEAVNRALLSGKHDRITALDTQFVRPLVLPAKVGVFLEQELTPGEFGLSVGDAAGGPAYLKGSVTLRA
jgi:hypothetical protein